jgi:ATP/maltotriose-dependent transcriptional regulator MalT
MHLALRGSTGPRLSRRLEEELPNLRAALAHDLVADPAAALATVGNLDWWYRRGHAGEALNWAGRALAAAPQAPPARIALAHSVMAISHLLLGQPAAAHQPLHAAAAALERADPADPFTRHVACLLAFYRSAAALFTGDLPVAETLSVQASAISRDVGEPVMEAAADTVRGTVATLQGRSADAESLLLSATRRSQEFGYRWGVAWSGRQLAGVYVTQGRHQAALDVIRTAIASSLEEHDDTSTLACLLVAARVFAHLGRLDDAGALLAATQAYAAHAGLQPTLAEPTSIGDLHTLLRDRPSPPRHAPAGPVSTGSLSDIVSLVVPT